MPDVYVKPGEGRSVRVPSNGYALLPIEGGFVPDDVWLRRRFNDGDLVRADPATVDAPDSAEPSGPHTDETPTA